MQEINIISLLSKYSGEIAISAVTACAILLTIKKFCNLSNKIIVFLSFLLGVTCYLIVSAFFPGIDIWVRFANAVTCGALSLTISLCVIKLGFMSKDDIKKQLEKLLSSIVLSEQLDEVVDCILEKLATKSADTKHSLKDIIKEYVSLELDDEELENIAQFIISACGIPKNDTTIDKDQ